jgi:hypothetical protein
LAVGMASGCAGNGGQAGFDGLPREPEFRRNPNPKEQYELTVELANAPGPMVLSGASAIYHAPDCSYMVDRFAGASGQPSEGLRIELSPIGGNAWRGTFYRDAMLDEDYDGPQGAMRPCHWQLMQVGAAFTATGAPTDTIYGANLDGEDVTASIERTQVVYFTTYGYPGELVAGVAPQDSGDTDRPSLPEEDMFTVTLITRRVQP